MRSDGSMCVMLCVHVAQGASSFLQFSLCCLTERLKREERRREELYRQYFEEIQRRFDAERPVDCSVIVVNKQTK